MPILTLKERMKADARVSRLKLQLQKISINKLIALQCYDTQDLKLVRERNGVSKDFLYYHRKKLGDKDFHSKWHGGKRWEKFSSEERKRIEDCLKRVMKIDSTTLLREYKDICEEYLNLDVSINDVHKIFSKWGLTVKKTNLHQKDKFNEENMRKMKWYINWRYDTDSNRIHFLDESTFCEDDLVRNRGRAPQGERCHHQNDQPLGDTVMMTALLTHSTDPQEDRPPVYVAIREGTNDAETFMDFLICACRAGIIRRGEFVVMDNASIHHADEIDDEITELCEIYGFTIVYLPAYFPEFNPCENIFGITKQKLRTMRREHRLAEEILLIVAQIKGKTIQNLYKHCNPLEKEIINATIEQIQEHGTRY